MDETQLGEMRAAIAKSPVTQRELAAAMGIQDARLSKWLNAERRPPDWFLGRFWPVLRRLTEEKAAELRAEAERKAQQILASVPEIDPGVEHDRNPIEALP